MRRKRRSVSGLLGWNLEKTEQNSSAMQRGYLFPGRRHALKLVLNIVLDPRELMKERIQLFASFLFGIYIFYAKF